jgi:hypothetical protein
MTKKFTLSHFRLCILIALSCFSWMNSNAQCYVFGSCQGSEYISSIKYSNISFSVPQSVCLSGALQHDTANECPGNIDTMTITTALKYMSVGLFIDTNNNGVFQGNEFFYGNYDTTLNGMYKFPINLGNLHPGLYTARAFSVGLDPGTNLPYYPTANDSCANFVNQYGNYYQFEIRVLDSVHITSQPASVNGCLGSTITFSVGTTGSQLSYQWYKDSTMLNGNGAHTATYTIPSFSKTDTDYYYVIVSNKCVTDTSNRATLTIHPTPPVSVAISGPTTFCPGGQVRFTGNDSIGYTHKWLYNTTVLADTTRRDTAYQPGVYRYIVSNGCPDTAAAITVAFFPTSVPTVSPAGLTKVCATTLDTFTTPVGVGVRYQWQVNTGIPNVYVNIPNDTLTYITTNIAGNYVLVLTDSNNCVTKSLPSTLQENSPATVNISTLASPYLCAGGYITLMASSNDTGEKFRWQFNGAPITPASSATGSNYNAYQAGNYSVIGNNGCLVTSASFHILVVPFPNVIVNGQLVFCGSGSTLLSSSVTDTSLRYQWQKNGVNIAGATGTTYNAQDSGSYSVVVISNHTCTAGSTPVTVIFNPLPSPVISLGSDKITLTVAPNYHSYQWYFNDVLIPAPAGVHGSYIAHTAGNYKVAVTDDKGCTGTSAEFPAPGDPQSVSTVNAASVSVYPNPATSVVRITAPVSVNVTINAIDGRAVLTQTNAKEINIQQLADGVYTMHITDVNGNTIKVEKLVKASK